MLKLMVTVFAIALAGTASGGWRDLRVDGSSKEAFAQSMAAFKQDLSPARQYVFGEALKDIWNQSAKAAETQQRAYTADEFYNLLDGLRYEEVVKYTDPTGDTAKRRLRAASSAYRAPPSTPAPIASSGPERWTNTFCYECATVGGQ